MRPEEDMRMRRMSLMTLAFFVGFAVLSAAGDKKQCTKSADECVKAMSQKYTKAAWLGIETDKNEKGRAVVKAVTPDSPAAAAGFQASDVLVALNGVELGEANKDALMKVKSLAPGSEASYTVLRKGGKMTLTARLAAPPRSVVAQWIGEHMLAEHAGTQVAEK
jgi:C-terminal processing protease CtpA/Prc